MIAHPAIDIEAVEVVRGITGIKPEALSQLLHCIKCTYFLGCVTEVKTLLPVMVYVHGGAFVFGSGDPRNTFTIKDDFFLIEFFEW